MNATAWTTQYTWRKIGKKEQKRKSEKQADVRSQNKEKLGCKPGTQTPQKSAKSANTKGLTRVRQRKMTREVKASQYSVLTSVALKIISWSFGVSERYTE